MQFDETGSKKKRDFYPDLLASFPPEKAWYRTSK